MVGPTMLRSSVFTLCSRRLTSATPLPELIEFEFLRRWSSSSEASTSHPTPAQDPPTSSANRVSCRLSTRGIVGIDGRDAFHFMQGLLTNDVMRLSADPPPSSMPTPTPNQPVGVHPPLYSAMLNHQGRVLFDLLFYRAPDVGAKLDRTGAGPESAADSAPSLLVDVDAASVDDLLSLLNKYRLRAHVGFQDLSGSLAAWASFSAPPEAAAAGPASSGLVANTVGWGGGVDGAGQAAAQCDESGFMWHADPRLPDLGLRGVFPASATPPLVEADSTVPEAEYCAWRYQHGVAEGATEIPREDALPLEYSMDGLNGVSYDKGCYVGQELTARTHHRGVVRKRVMPVMFRGADDGSPAVPPQVGADVVDRGSERTVGRLIAAQGGWGLAHLRLSQALLAAAPDARSGPPPGAPELVVAGDRSSVVIVPLRPLWWPDSWGREEGQ